MEVLLAAALVVVAVPVILIAAYIAGRWLSRLIFGRDTDLQGGEAEFDAADIARSDLLK